jgi:hypothetical protein|tara:strand:+ start:366 stop:518 length:153 start_codon:yes stop_codon:yes gene_type:complete
MKKLLIYGGIAVVVLVLLFIVVSPSDKNEVSNEPEGGIIEPIPVEKEWDF